MAAPDAAPAVKPGVVAMFTPEQIAKDVFGYPTTPIPSTYFGLHYFNRGNGTWPSPRDIFGDQGPGQIKFGELRLWDAGVAWREVNPKEARVYDWSKLDEMLDFAEAHQLPVLYTFGHTPTWALGGFFGGSIDHGKKKVAPPAHVDWSIFDNFVADIVRHAKGRIKYWDVWNEPDGELFFNGTMADVATMAKHVRDVVKAIDPDAVVVGPSVQGWGSPVFPRLGEFLAAGGAAYVDEVAFHGRLNPNFNGGNKYPENIFTLVEGLRAQLAKSRDDDGKLLYDTECGWAPNQVTDPIEQANYVARQYLCRWSLGIRKNSWYSMISKNWGSLWSPTDGLRPAGVAYGQVYQWMVGATMTQPVVLTKDQTWTVCFSRPGGYESLAIWNTGATTTYTPDAKYKQYRDLIGKVTRITGAVTIGAAPILLETGDPVR
jgi:polysaccharide biosynthesis protein PslG